MLMGMQGRHGAQLITEGVNAVDHHRRVCGCLLFRFDLKALCRSCKESIVSYPLIRQPRTTPYPPFSEKP